MQTWQFIQQKLAASNAVVLLYVLESNGSSPGRQGFKMAVADDGSFYGSIGGGIMEYKFVELAKAKLAETALKTSVHKQVHNKDAGNNKSGMICSGEQTVMLYQLQEKDIAHINSLVHSLLHNKNGSLRLSYNELIFSEEIPSANFYFEQKNETDFLLIEKTGFKNELHIIGGGHCALALSKLTSVMDFFITVYEERTSLNTFEQNIYAHKKQLVNSYQELNGLINPGNNIYVAIMTFGYRTDDIALKALLGKDFKYIGLLGSQNKVKKMFEQYKFENINSSWIQNIHAPIGLQIKSQTPDEIAISIAAEIIAVKNADQ